MIFFAMAILMLCLIIGVPVPISFMASAACATLSCVGSTMFPRFRDERYPRGQAAALLGLLIPPNATLIIFAWISGQSVLACFLATVVPGLVTIALLCTVNTWLLRNNTTIKVTGKQDRTFQHKVQLFRQRGKLAMPALLLPVIVLGGI